MEFKVLPNVEFKVDSVELTIDVVVFNNVEFVSVEFKVPLNVEFKLDSVEFTMESGVFNSVEFDSVEFVSVEFKVVSVEFTIESGVFNNVEFDKVEFKVLPNVEFKVLPNVEFKVLVNGVLNSAEFTGSDVFDSVVLDNDVIFCSVDKVVTDETREDIADPVVGEDEVIVGVEDITDDIVADESAVIAAVIVD